MKRRGWTLSTLATVMLTGIVAYQSGWFADESTVCHDLPSSPTCSARSASAEPSEPSLNWRQGQPRHWRCLMLHH